MEALIAVIGIICLIPALIFYSSMSWGYVVSTFYVWFILPVFPDLPHFTLLQFIGFLLFVGIFTRHEQVAIKSEYKDNSGYFIGLLLAPWLTLLFGYVVHLFY